MTPRFTASSAYSLVPPAPPSPLPPPPSPPLPPNVLPPPPLTVVATSTKGGGAFLLKRRTCSAVDASLARVTVGGARVPLSGQVGGSQTLTVCDLGSLLAGASALGACDAFAPAGSLVPGAMIVAGGNGCAQDQAVLQPGSFVRPLTYGPGAWTASQWVAAVRLRRLRERARASASSHLLTCSPLPPSQDWTTSIPSSVSYCL